MKRNRVNENEIFELSEQKKVAGKKKTKEEIKMWYQTFYGTSIEFLMCNN